MYFDHEVAANIQTNLKRFGLEDERVRGEFDGMRGKVDMGEHPLSELCAAWRDKRNDMRVFRDEAEIGFIKGDGQFFFVGAPDLRQCLGWVIATDLGQEKVLDYDLDIEAGQLSATFNEAPSPDGDQDKLRTFFFDGSFSQKLKDAVKKDKSSRFDDGYYAAMNVLWHVGTRTILGRGHRGFDFYR